MIETNVTALQKVVVQFGSKTIKGYIESPASESSEQLLESIMHGFLETIRIRRIDSDTVEEISTSDVKAVYYVNSFEGNSSHKELNFHSRAPIPQGIWMRFQFLDGEVMEGIVVNSIRYLIDPGFFVLPTAPDSNNKLAYIVKTWLVDHRVLGLRKFQENL
jgi:Family of unknown function (DUF6982)